MTSSSQTQSTQRQLLLVLVLALTIISIHISLVYAYFQRNIVIQHIDPPHEYPLVDLFVAASQVLPAEDFIKDIRKLIDLNLMEEKYRFKFSVDNYPKWPTLVTAKTWPKIVRTLDPSSTHMELSYQINQHQWLNFASHNKRSFFIFSGPLLLIELIIISLIILYLWSMARFVEPLHQVKIMSERLGQDLVGSPLDETGPEPLREATKAINAMQKRIQSLINSRTRFLAAISHDLRTPITRLKLRAQFIENPAHSEKIIRDLDEMENLITRLLEYVRENGTLQKHITLDINSLLQTICDDYVDLGFVVNYTPASNKRVAFSGNPLALKRAFTNIIGNATKYATEVWVTLDEGENKVIIIEDNGSGIPEDEIEKVFEDFYRVESAKTTIGSGLGLSIALNIIEQHHGSIVLKNRLEGGLRVTVTLPTVVS